MSDDNQTGSPLQQGIGQLQALGAQRGGLLQREQLLSEEERQQKALARQRQIALLRRAFTSPGGALPTSGGGLLGG